MDLLLDKLLRILEEQVAIFKTLLTILKEEESAIVLSDFKMLNEILKKKEDEVLKHRFLEVKREKIIQKITPYMGVSASDLTLSNLAKRIDEPYARQLRECCDELEKLMQAIHTINRKNKTLVERSLQLVKDSLSLLDNIITPSPVYYNTGRLTNSDQGGRVFCGSI